jgi:hypothetical protein
VRPEHHFRAGLLLVENPFDIFRDGLITKSCADFVLIAEFDFGQLHDDHVLARQRPVLLGRFGDVGLFPFIEAPQDLGETVGGLAFDLR